MLLNLPQLKETQLQRISMTQEVLLKSLKTDLTLLKRITMMLKMLSMMLKRNLMQPKQLSEMPTLQRISLLKNTLLQLWDWKTLETNSKMQEDARPRLIWQFKMLKTL